MIVAILLIFALGFRTGQYSIEKSKREPSFSYKVKNLQEKNTRDIDFSLFWETWNALEDHYVDKKKLDPNQLYYGAIKGMVASVGDSYTFFLTPEENKQSKDDLGGHFEGIGAELGLKNNQIVVVTPLKNSPAEKAGVKAGDIISKVDGASTANLTLNQAVSKIRGPKGKKVVLTMSRKEKEIDISVVRDQINVPFVELSYEEKTAIIELSRFGDDTDRLWDQAINKIVDAQEKGNVDSIVLDMRGNPGGYLDGAVYIASEFLPKGSLVVKQEFADKPTETYLTKREGKLLSIPLVVLVNEGSASAAEIVAGALRDYKRATLVGEKTFGKGSVQQAIDLKDGAGVHVTISKWILPKGDWIHQKGIEPKTVVKNEIPEGNTLTKENDLQLKKAIEIVRQ